jgi:transposase
VPAVPASFIEPLWVQFSALLPQRPVYHPGHPLGCHRRRVGDRVIFDKLVQVLKFGCSYEQVAEPGCGATTIRQRRDEWIGLGVFAQLKGLVLQVYDRIVGLELADLAANGCITKAPGGGELAGRSPVDRGKRGMKCSALVDAAGVPLGRVLAPANRHDSPLLGHTLDILDELGPLPAQVTVHLDRGFDSDKTRTELAERGLRGQIAERGTPAPIQAGRRWPVERTRAWQNAFNRLQRCYERRQRVIDAFFDLADAIITVRKIIRYAWTNYRWHTRPKRRP